jgi:Galactosyltransferase
MRARMQVKNIVVTHGKKEHPHNSDEFYEHTGLKAYPKYMVGGGYLISSDVARMVVVANQLVGLKLYTVEDATFGYWLSAWDIRHVHNPKFRCALPGHTVASKFPSERRLSWGRNQLSSLKRRYGGTNSARTTMTWASVLP